MMQLPLLLNSKQDDVVLATLSLITNLATKGIQLAVLSSSS